MTDAELDTFDTIESALNRASQLVLDGGVALPAVSYAVNGEHFDILLAVEPEDMARGLNMIRSFLVYQKVQSFLFTMQTAEPEGIAAALYAETGAVGLWRSIERRRLRKIRIGRSEALATETLNELAFMRPTRGENLDGWTAAKIAKMLDLHRQHAAGPIIIQGDALL